MQQPRHPSLPVVTAAVRASGRFISYCRCGTGPTVVLLAPGRLPQDLMAALTARFRVIAPDLPSAPSDVSGEWLGTLFEALGIATAAMVADPRVGEAALALQHDDPERVLGVVPLVGTPGSIAEAVARLFPGAAAR